MEQLRHDITDDFEVLYKEQGGRFAEQAQKYKEQYEKQKAEDIKRLKEVQREKKAAFKKTMEDSIHVIATQRS